MLRLRPLAALSGNAGSKRFETRQLLRCFSSFGNNLDRWQRRCDRLTQLQRRIRFPPPQTLTVRSQTYKLPLPAVEPVRKPTRDELQYLVGFFDGDGCVSMKKQTGELTLEIGQNIDSAEVLWQFRSLFGGSVTHHSAPTGSRKAAVQWRVCGPKMKAAAEILSRIPSMKQPQLLIAANGSVADNDSARVAERLQTLKGSQHELHQWNECSWPYFAGFFDAEGCIIVQPLRPGLQLRLGQLNPCALVRLLRFLHDNQLKTWSLYHYASLSVLACTSNEDCRQTLELLLENGLLVKRKQAELGLTLTGENHLHIRDAISSLNGWQGRYQRLDTDGITRAREIKRLQATLYRLTGPEHASLFSRIEELCAEHKLQKLISRCDLLRKDIQQSLRQGGQVVSPTICPS